MAAPGFSRPFRTPLEPLLDDPSVAWRSSVSNYVNKSFCFVN